MQSLKHEMMAGGKNLRKERGEEDKKVKESRVDKIGGEGRTDGVNKCAEWIWGRTGKGTGGKAQTNTVWAAGPVSETGRGRKSRTAFLQV